MKYLLLTLLLLWFLLAAFSQHYPTNIEQRIKQVERKWRQAVQLAGQSKVGYPIAEQIRHFVMP